MYKIRWSSVNTDIQVVLNLLVTDITKIQSYDPTILLYTGKNNVNKIRPNPKDLYPIKTSEDELYVLFVTLNMT